jgi:hypothetical protein
MAIVSCIDGCNLQGVDPNIGPYLSHILAHVVNFLGEQMASVTSFTWIPLVHQAVPSVLRGVRDREITGGLI